MLNRAALKARAKEQIRGNVLMLLLATFVPSLISILLNFVPVLGTLVAVLITPVLQMGVLVVFLNLAYGNPHSIGQAFSLLDFWWKGFCLTFRIGLSVLLWSLLFYIPGIVAMYRYSMAPYIFAENPDLSNSEILFLSKEMTDGHKWDLFVLSLSFIGWAILCYVTLGLALIWVIPYVQATMAHTYLTLKTEYNHR